MDTLLTVHVYYLALYSFAVAPSWKYNVYCRCVTVALIDQRRDKCNEMRWAEQGEEVQRGIITFFNTDFLPRKGAQKGRLGFA